MFLVQYDTTHFGWVDYAGETNWVNSLFLLENCERYGHPSRIVELDENGGFVRVVTNAEIVNERLNR